MKLQIKKHFKRIFTAECVIILAWCLICILITSLICAWEENNIEREISYALEFIPTQISQSGIDIKEINRLLYKNHILYEKLESKCINCLVKINEVYVTEEDTYEILDEVIVLNEQNFGGETTTDSSRDIIVSYDNKSYLLTVEYSYNIIFVAIKSTDMLYTEIMFFIISQLIFIMYIYRFLFAEKLRNERETERENFLKAAAHEIRTPITVIRANAECLREIKDEDKQKRYIDSIIEQTYSMTEKTNAILNYSRISFNSQPDLKKCDLKEITLAALEQVEANSSLKEIEFNLYFDDRCETLADKGLMEIVISNFISNVIKYAEDGTTAQIRIENKKFSIKNKCENFSKEDLKHIWDELYTVNESRTGESFGLGLSICRRILEKHDFKYGCDNIESGVIFWFEFK